MAKKALINKAAAKPKFMRAPMSIAFAAARALCSGVLGAVPQSTPCAHGTK